MMNMRIPICFSFFCFFGVINSMDDFVSTSVARKCSKDIVIPVIDQQKTAVPPLDLNNAGRNGSSSEGSQKRNLNDLDTFRKAVSVKVTARRNGESGATTQNIPTRSGISHSSDIKSPTPLTDAPQKAPSILPTAITRNYSGKILLQEEKTYSESEIWEKLKTFNPILWSFGQKYNMNLEDLERFASFLQEEDTGPQVIAEHLRRSNNILQQKTWRQRALEYIFRSNGDEARFNLFNEHLERIKKEDPENYNTFVLELIKITQDQAEGRHQKFQIDTMHSTLLTQENSDQLHQIREQRIQTLAASLVSIGMGAWALYGQVGTVCQVVNATMALL